MRIAIIDEDAALAARLCGELARNGWFCRPHPDGRQFISQLHRESYDACIVGLATRSPQCLDLLKAIRSSLAIHVPVIGLAQQDDEQGVIDALEAGADDIVVKPPRIGELRARLNARWRRHAGVPGAGHAFRYDRFLFDLKRQEARMRDLPVDLTQKEFQLALLLLRHIGTPLSRSHIREIVWGRDTEVPSRTMDTHVSRVRAKLSLRPDSGYLLAPVYGFGYRLEHLSSGPDPRVAPVLEAASPRMG
jgi:DNA-binding response OmpR family regulator